MENKLTYLQIYQLVAEGKYGLIPEGYKIRWWGGIAPGRVSDLELDGSRLTITRNEFPHPDKIRISGDRMVVIPPPSYDIHEEPVEFGEVYIHVEFALTHIEFIYCKNNVAAVKVVNTRVNEYADIATSRGFISKDNFVFDTNVDIDNGILSIHDLMFNNCVYPPLTYDELDDKDELLTVSFNYDWWDFVPHVDRVTDI